jgi:phosphomannomutase
MNKLLLFDVDGTIAESGNIINREIILLLHQLNINYDIGIVGGGTFAKIQSQINNQIVFTHIFSECGSVYHKYDFITNEYTLIYENDIKKHKHFNKINILCKLSLKYISNCDYELAGHIIDRRNGLFYISMIGMQATENERKTFLHLDKISHYRNNLLSLLNKELFFLEIDKDIDVKEGGTMGIAIYPKEWNKTQVLQHIVYDKIYYFGDKYEKNGNDYELLNHNDVFGIAVQNIDDTINKLQNF